MRFGRTMIRNEIQEASGGGAGESFDVSSDNSEIIGTPDVEAFKGHGLDPAKYGFDLDAKEEVKASYSQGSDETQEEAGQATDEKSYLEWVNKLGAIHNGNPVKVDSIDGLKNLIQMGQDYTAKTQSLSEERKAWESERGQVKAELEATQAQINETLGGLEKQIKEMQQWEFTLNELRNSAPDLFEEIQRAYEGTTKHFSNPILDQQLHAMRKELDEVKKGLTSREDKLILDSFESDMAKAAPLEQSLKELGITVNKDEVKQKWAQTGLSVEEAISALYGRAMLQAQASKAKVETTKAKVAARPQGAASASRPGKSTPNVKNDGNYLRMAQQIYNNMR